MAQIELSDVEMTLVADCINERIGWLDAKYQELRYDAEIADAYTMFVDELETNRIMRANYASIVRRLEQQLDVVKADAILAVPA